MPHSLTKGKQFFLLLDVAHNIQSIENLIAYVQKHIKQKHIHFVFNVLNDKIGALNSIVTSLSMMPCTWYIAPTKTPRAIQNSELKTELLALNQCCFTFDSTEKAFHKAINLVQDNDLIIGTGSFFVVSEILHLVKSKLYLV